MGVLGRRVLLTCGILASGIIAGAVPAVHEAGAQAGVWLVTSQEAAMPPSATSNAGRSITRGPAIRQVSPAAPVAANQPFDLRVDFAGRGGEKINLASAQVLILRGGNLNITQRVKPFITAGGIEMPAAMVPAGTHVLQVTVADSGGRQTIANIEIDAK
jgi:hypothetical protein